MGMELIPLNPGASGLRYSGEGWRWIRHFAHRNGVATDQFSEWNDGDPLDAETCCALATAIERNQSEYNKVFAGKCYGPSPADGHAGIWRESSGFEQW